MAIKDWHEDERPREKLIKKGARNLTSAELLAIILGSGTKEISAVDLAKQILQSVSYDLSRLENMSVTRLQEFNGIGPAKAVLLNAAFELGRRRAMQQSNAIKKITRPQEAFELLKPYLENLNREEFWIIYLRKNKILGAERLMEGGLDFSQIDLRLFWKRVLEMNATEIIIAHNHPSGNLEPSQSDLELTRKIKSAGKNLSVNLLDHLIIANNEFISLNNFL